MGEATMAGKILVTAAGLLLVAGVNPLGGIPRT